MLLLPPTRLVPIVRLDLDWMWYTWLVNERGEVDFVSTKRFFSLAEAKRESERLRIAPDIANDN